MARPRHTYLPDPCVKCFGPNVWRGRTISGHEVLVCDSCGLRTAVPALAKTPRDEDAGRLPMRPAASYKPAPPPPPNKPDMPAAALRLKPLWRGW